MSNYIKMKKSGRRHTIKNFLGGADMRFDEGIIGEGTAAVCKNFRFESGALTDGYGLAEDAKYAGFTVWSLWDYERYDAAAGAYICINMMCSASGQVYYYDGGWKELAGAVFSSAPRAFVYRLYGEDTVIMTSETDGMYTWDGVSAAERIEGSPMITSHAMHYERMFVTAAGEQNTVYFSDDLDPTNWNETLAEGGYIQLLDERGKLLKVVDYLNYVYIFREYGISRLAAYADQQDFYVVNLYVAGGRINRGSVVHAGGCIMLLAGEGMYSFDGYDLTRRLKNLEFEASPEAVALYSDSKYYLAARLKGWGGKNGQNNAIIVYDLSSGGYSVTAAGVSGLMKSGGNIYAVTNEGALGRLTRDGLLFGKMTEKIWQSGYSDFGTPDKKALSEVTLTTDKSLFLIITADGVDHTFAVYAEDRPVRIKTNISAHRFRFKLQAFEPGSCIKRMSYVLR